LPSADWATDRLSPRIRGNVRPPVIILTLMEGLA
jgi:hypothetical protein